MAELNKDKIVNATKWSAVTELVAKLILPITNMVLARLLAPEAFGVVATITMIVSFAEIFTDAGFQKYLIQRDFRDENERKESTDVAFWSNLSLSLVIWLIIGLFCEPLARLVGNPGLGKVITISCVSIPLAAFSSIQMALYKRDFDFRTLFKVRIVGILIPIFITIPLAIWLHSYWALVIGTIASNLANAIILSWYSKWKPSLFYSWKKLQEMLSFSIWSMVESITIWLTSYIDIFIIGVYLNEYYLGIYKTSMTTVGQITSLITAATTPILFSSLSRLQKDRNEFDKMFFNFQKMVGLIIIPIGFGIFCFRDFITSILLGNQWGDAANFIGLWGLTSSITIVLSHYSSEVYRSLGKPRLSVLAQILHIVVLCPAMMLAVQYNWDTIFICRSVVRLELVLVNLIIMHFIIKISIRKMISNILPALFAATIMGAIGIYLANYNSSIGWAIISICICIIIYFAIVCCFPKDRSTLYLLIKQIKNR